MTGNELKTQRDKIGVSQEKLAQALDVAVSTVARWEQLKENEIPNSRMLELSLIALEVEAGKK
jgi:transcriptional regulator with XRE-family HTH domain